MSEREPGPGPGTRAVHPPEAPRPEQVPLSVPVYRSATFRFETAAEYAAVLAGEKPGFVYSRYGNPTTQAFAEAVAALESAEAGVPFASGMGATTTVLLSLLSAGDHVVAPAAAYGGTYGFLATWAPRWGIATTFVDMRDPDAVAAAMRPETRVVWAETLANPTMAVTDLAAVAAVARGHGAAFVVDSTFATPVLCRPLDLGADLVLHSATKYLAGHSDVSAGVVVGSGALVEKVRQGAIMLGPTMSPDDAWIVLRGLATLPLRMERHCRSAAALAAELEGHPALLGVSHPSLVSSPDHHRAEALFPPGLAGGVVALHVKGGVSAGQAFCDSLRLAANATSLGGTHTYVSHVATTTHRQLDADALEAAGIHEGTVRMSVGLEDPEDLLADIRQALAVVTGR